MQYFGGLVVLLGVLIALRGGFAEPSTEGSPDRKVKRQDVFYGLGLTAVGIAVIASYFALEL